MRFSPKQKQVYHNLNSKLNILEGSVRSGKTFLANAYALKMFGEDREGLPKDACDIMVGKTAGSLKRNVIDPILDMVGSGGHYYSGKQEFHLWGNVIHVIGANDDRAESKIRGMTVRKALGDELTLWPENFFKQLDMRMSTEKSMLLGTTNPDNPNHWLKKEFIDRQGEIDLTATRFVLDDNDYLPKAFVSNLKKTYSGLWYKRFISGLWVLAEGSVYDFYDESKHLIKKCPIGTEYFVGVDYGTGNPTVFLLIGYNPKTTPPLWCEKEYYHSGRDSGRQKTDAEYSRDLADFIGKTPVDGIYIDPSAASFKLQVKRDHYFTLIDADNSVIDGIRFVASWLKSGKYKIHESCTHYRNEFGGYVWDSKAQILGEDKPIKQNDHCHDPARYVIYTRFGEAAYDITKLLQM